MIQHLAIKASAGSGKTYTLARRYIAILSRGAEPSEIIALTFSRKAAGEIFDSIIQTLVVAASDPATAKRTAEEIKQPDYGCEEFTALLSQMLASLHRLHINTLDSFATSVLKAFPNELGIPWEFSIMDEHGPEGQQARAEVFETLFHGQQLSEEEEKHFMLAFRMATFGKESKSVMTQLENYVEDFLPEFRAKPEAAAWGNASRIWPEGCQWLKEETQTPEECLVIINDEIERSDWADGFKNTLRQLASELAAFDQQSPWPDLKTLGKTFIENFEALGSGVYTFSYSRKEYELSARAAGALQQLIHHLVRNELERSLVITHGLHHCIALFETYYDRLVRRQGRLTFSDTQYLLTPSNTGGSVSGLTRHNDDAGRLYIDYRLDETFNHWMLDEFQDTSDLQWAALANLVDETIQTEEDRSLFYVGDVKQAIYSWRGGNPALFDQLLKQYPIIETQELSESARSAPEILNVVNKVFSDLKAFECPTPALEMWSGLWRKHELMQGVAPAEGFVQLVEPLPSDDEKQNEEDYFRAAADVLNEIQPAQRGLTSALLVRTNKVATALSDYLRAHCPDMQIIHEGSSPLNDCPASSLLLQLVAYASHPANTLALQQLMMSPLREELMNQDEDQRAVYLLHMLQELGYASFMEYWGQRLREQNSLADFGNTRIESLIEAGANFDKDGNGQPDEFLRYVEGLKTSQGESQRAVRIMTIHQSKGLGFDIVILPSLMDRGRMLASSQKDPLLLGSDWALVPPNSSIHSLIPEFEAPIEAMESRNAFEALCVLYVAMTRAKKALYMISGFPGKSSKSENSAWIIKQQLTGNGKDPEATEVLINGNTHCEVYSEGNPTWYTAENMDPSESVIPKTTPTPSWIPSQESQQVISPSQIDRQAEDAGTLFTTNHQHSFDLGTAVHHLFEHIEWIDGVDLDKLCKQWMQTYDGELALKEESIAHFEKAIASEEVIATLSKPSEPATIWNEKAFQLNLEGQFISGIFDRVVLYGEPGQWTRAEILDFKTNRVNSSEDVQKHCVHYRPQLESYQKVLALLTGIPKKNITKALIFTRTGQVSAVD